MGWWNARLDGSSFANPPTGLVWGDEPADAMDTMLARVKKSFEDSMSRSPTVEEIRAGLEFSLPHAMTKAEDKVADFVRRPVMLTQPARDLLQAMIEVQVAQMIDYAQTRDESLAWARSIDEIASMHGLKGGAVESVEEHWDRRDEVPTAPEEKS